VTIYYERSAAIIWQNNQLPVFSVYVVLTLY